MGSRSGKPEKVRVFSNTDKKPRKSQEILLKNGSFNAVLTARNTISWK